MRRLLATIVSVVGTVIDVAVRRAGEPAQFKLTVGERREA
mgnify:CR=1 FL=1